MSTKGQENTRKWSLIIITMMNNDSVSQFNTVDTTRVYEIKAFSKEKCMESANGKQLTSFPVQFLEYEGAPGFRWVLKPQLVIWEK